MNINSAFKSTYLKYTDLEGKRVLVMMERVEVETVGQGLEAEDKPVLYFKGKERGLVLNKTNAYSISEIVGSEETDEWAGHRIILHPDKTTFGGKRVDCIRVSAPPAAPTAGNGSRQRQSAPLDCIRVSAPPAAPTAGNGSRQRQSAPPPPPVEDEEPSDSFVADDSDVPF